MGLQDAIEAPRLSTEHFPGFFAPHRGVPNRVRIEARFGTRVIDELRRRGHDIDVARFGWMSTWLEYTECQPKH